MRALIPLVALVLGGCSVVTVQHRGLASTPMGAPSYGAADVGGFDGVQARIDLDRQRLQSLPMLDQRDLLMNPMADPALLEVQRLRPWALDGPFRLPTPLPLPGVDR